MLPLPFSRVSFSFLLFLLFLLFSSLLAAGITFFSLHRIHHSGMIFLFCFSSFFPLRATNGFASQQNPCCDLCWLPCTCESFTCIKTPVLPLYPPLPFPCQMPSQCTEYPHDILTRPNPNPFIGTGGLLVRRISTDLVGFSPAVSTPRHTPPFSSLHDRCPSVLVCWVVCRHCCRKRVRAYIDR